MEKLIELLNEYEKEVKKSEFYEWEKWIWWNTNLFRRDTRDEEWSHIYSDTADTYVISKKYGFIKWLVENEKVNPYDPSYNVPTHIALWVDDWDGDFMVYERFFKEEELLMLLSIQDEPINFLVSILK